MGESVIFGKQFGEHMEEKGSDKGLKMSCCGCKYGGLAYKVVLPAWAGSIFTKSHKKLMICCRVGSKMCEDMAEVSKCTYSVC